MSDEQRNEQVERLVSVQRVSRAIADSSAEWWRRLSEAADAVISGDALETLYRESLAAMHQVLGADEVSILTADDAGEALVARTSIGLGEKGVVELRIPAGQGMAGRVLSTRKPLVVGDLNQINLVNPALVESGQLSVAAVPILSEGRIFGVLHAGSKALEHFTDSDVELLQILAERLAVVLDRVRLFEEQRRLANLASFLAATAKIMGEAGNLADALERLAGAALAAVGDICLIDILDEGILTRLVARHRDPSRQALVDRLRTEFPPDPVGAHPAADVIRHGGTRWSATMSDEFLHTTTYDAEHYEITKALGFQSYLAVAVGAEGNVVGALTMVSCSRPFTASDVGMAEILAGQVGSVVAKTQQLDLAARTSHVLQAALLPSELPDVPGVTFRSRYEAAAENLDVGGDFYDVMALPGDEAMFMIGDVAGHDRSAAALMGQLRSAARILAIQGLWPSELLSELQSSWSALGFERIATVLVGRIDARSGMVVLASAGHLPPLLVDGDEADYSALEPAPPLGTGVDHPTSLRIVLRPGQMLLLYTDGALDERDGGIDAGMDRVRKAVAAGPVDAAAVCQRVIDLYAVPDDDIALLAVRFEGLMAERSDPSPT